MTVNENPVFSADILRELLDSSVLQRQDLRDAYSHLPATRCRRNARCCSLLPEMTLLEALSAIRQLLDMSPAVRKGLTERVMRYFFLNPVEILSCPFLVEKGCLIYQDRFFGCRAYGLWSGGYYEDLASRSRQAKLHFRMQWERLGVSLPREVMDFQVPYCSCVEPEGAITISDEQLLHIAETIDSLSAQFQPWHQLFGERYFYDLSFLLASLAFGVAGAVRTKFEIVRDVAASQDRSRLERILEDIPDILAACFKDA